ncbi:MAG: hypothetical protein Kow0099_08270 [Candidatus Abyssubacteria bacterium]
MRGREQCESQKRKNVEKLDEATRGPPRSCTASPADGILLRNGNAYLEILLRVAEWQCLWGTPQLRKRSLALPRKRIL